MGKEVLRDTDLPYVLDLFSGCGGLGLGFANAGFPILASVDNDQSAVRTAAHNLTNLQDSCQGYLHKGLCKDVRNLDTSEILQVACERELIVVGGPPCQAYSMAGRGKLRSLGVDREHTKDERGNLYLSFLKAAIEANALVVLMENVPAAMSYGNINVPEEACAFLQEKGYEAKWSILNAADFGVPQRRERLFVIATRKGTNMHPALPHSTHECPKGSLTQTDRMKRRLIESNKYFEEAMPAHNPKPWVSVENALSDLPRLFPTSDSPYYFHKASEAYRYASEPKNEFQSTMRAGRSLVCGHGFRRTTRDFPIFEQMLEGDDYRAAVKIADQLFRRALENTGIDKMSDPIRYRTLKKKIIPPYSLEKFHDKWKRLKRDEVSHTLPAHLGTDTYSHIHYSEPRGISIREAARLQSFPDNFEFPSTMSDAFKQIGNAVPPLLSEAIANCIKKEILKSYE